MQAFAHYVCVCVCVWLHPDLYHVHHWWVMFWWISPDNPCRQQGDIVNIRLHEEIESIQQPDGMFKPMAVDTFIQMNYGTGEWKRIKKYREVQAELEWFCVCVCLCVCICAWMNVHLAVSVSLFICFACLAVHLSTYVLAYLPACVTISLCLYACLTS